MQHSIIISFVVGKRRQKEANNLLKSVKARSYGHIPLFSLMTSISTKQQS